MCSNNFGLHCKYKSTFLFIVFTLQGITQNKDINGFVEGKTTLLTIKGTGAFQCAFREVYDSTLGNNSRAA